MKYRIGAVLLAGLVSSPVLAAKAGSGFVGLQYAQVTDSIYGTEPLIMVGRFGHFLTNSFSVEARAGFGVSDGQFQENSGIGIEVDSLFGAYAVGHLPLSRYSDMVSVYGLAGVSQAELTVKSDTAYESADDSSLSFGAGIQVGLTPVAVGTLEYMFYFGDVSAISAGLTFPF